MEAPYRLLPSKPVPPTSESGTAIEFDVEGLFPTMVIGLVGLILLVSAVRHHAAGTLDGRAAVLLLVISGACIADTFFGAWKAWRSKESAP